MPRDRVELFRESNTTDKEKIIVLAFEGNNTEHIYFEELKSFHRFNDELIYLHLLGRNTNDTKSAPKHVFEKLKKEAKDEYNFNKDDELWMIIDKDRWENIPEIIKMCKKQGNMFLAGSNPCFEIWLLLHLQDVNDLSQKETMDLLENKRISNKKRFIDQYLGDLLDEGYNKNNPKPERFLDLIDHALLRAKNLDNPKEDFPSKLGSHVYKIIEKIITN
jgi:hypothetical protein